MNISESLQTGASALKAHAWGMAVTAHNLANVNTAGFQPQNALLATGPNGKGVQLDAVLFQTDNIRQDPTQRPQAADQPNFPQSVSSQDFVRSSGTDMAREMVNMTVAQRTYEANTKMVQTADEMLGSLLDIKT